MQQLFDFNEMRLYMSQRTPLHVMITAARKLVRWWAFYCGILLSVPLVSFANNLIAPRIEILGEGQLPRPVFPSTANASSGVNDAQWAEVTGNEGNLRLRLIRRDTHRSSMEMAMRCTTVETGIMASTFLCCRSMTETVPAPTLEVYPREPSLEIASIWDCGSPVGMEPTTLRVFGSITSIERVSSAVT